MFAVFQDAVGKRLSVIQRHDPAFVGEGAQHGADTLGTLEVPAAAGLTDPHVEYGGMAAEMVSAFFMHAAGTQVLTLHIED